VCRLRDGGAAAARYPLRAQDPRRPPTSTTSPRLYGTRTRRVSTTASPTYCKPALTPTSWVPAPLYNVYIMSPSSFVGGVSSARRRSSSSSISPTRPRSSTASNFDKSHRLYGTWTRRVSTTASPTYSFLVDFFNTLERAPRRTAL
jgi:hypothetical protein